MNKREKAAVEVKKQIADAFWQLYKTKHISKITINEVCALSGYGRSTFYKYFNNIYEVSDYFASELADILYSNVDRKFDDFVTANWQDLAQNIVKPAEEHWEILQEIVSNNLNREMLSKLGDIAIERYGYPLVYDSLSPIPEENLEMFNFVFQWRIHGMYSSMYHYMRNKDKITPEQLEKVLASIQEVGDMGTLRRLAHKNDDGVF